MLAAQGVTLAPPLAAPLATASVSFDLVGPARVRDGDTIVVAGTPVRLSGLHCPEAREPGGAAATAAMRALVRHATVACALNGARSHDRMVGRCAVGAIDLGERLIEAGYCARCPRYDPAERYRAAQGEAGPWPGTLPGYCGRPGR
jgi:endonuclease YncB( thermonuclease family)